MATIPQNLAFEQIKEELVRVINYALGTLALPPHEVEMLIQGIHTEVSMLAKQELEKSIKAYQDEVAAEQAEAESATEETVEE